MAIRGERVYVPVIDIGIGTGWAAVRDARTRREVRVKVRTVKLVGGTVCVEAVSHGVEDGLHRVTLPGGEIAWVAILGPELGSAA